MSITSNTTEIPSKEVLEIDSICSFYYIVASNNGNIIVISVVLSLGIGP